MIELRLQEQALIGITKQELSKQFPEYDLIRQMERYGIREFMAKYKVFLMGRVLDFGSGKQPYKDLVAGEYVPHEIEGDENFTQDGSFDCVMCNQVTQYLSDLSGTLSSFRRALKPHGYLVMTYATNWDEVETSDLFRTTKAGMSRLLENEGFDIIKHERRSQVCFGNFKFPLGYGLVAQKFDV